MLYHKHVHVCGVLLIRPTFYYIPQTLQYLFCVIGIIGVCQLHNAVGSGFNLHILLQTLQY